MPVTEHSGRNGLHATPGVVSEAISRTPEWQLVQRVVASPAFVRSTLLTHFLLYVCDRKLQGREEEITEHQIGVHALGRPDNYHPGEDNVVRNYARMLRKRLEEFFEGDGRSEELRILIPRGQYVPTFEPAKLIHEPVATIASLETGGSEAGAPSKQTAAEDTPHSGSSAVPRVLNRRAFALSATAAVVGVSALGWVGMRHRHLRSPLHLYQAFWAQMFSAHRECFVVTGDSGLVLLHRLTGRNISLKEYVDGASTEAFREISPSSAPDKGPIDPGTMHYTSTADLIVAIALDRVAFAEHAVPQVRGARDMRMAEVEHSNAVFIGGPRANPWVELFQRSSEFQMKFYAGDGTVPPSQSIWNKRPRPGERQEYPNSAAAPPYTTYTLVSFLPSIDEEGWVLLLQGESLSGTRAAGDFVTDVNSLARVLERARRSDGSTGPFELILETQALGADAPKPRLVVERYESGKA